MMPTLLVVDDETAICRAFDRAFADDETKVITAASIADGERLFIEQSPDVVVLDLRLPDGSGFDMFKRIHEQNSRVPVIFITGHGTVDDAIEATKLGAYDYLFKPLELSELRDLLRKAFKLSQMVRVQPVIAEDDTPTSEGTIVGRCSAMKEVYMSIGRVAPQDVNVLLLGESGTGKELAAQAIYHHSHRANGPFRAINCAAIPDTLLESEIFGHERGAFTGAESKRIGKLEQCDSGTLFLDEVGDMSPMTQAKLLRVLQDQTFERVGGNESIRVDVRIVAATNHDLKQLVEEGTFRADLYFRLSVVSIQLPPLRDRGDDLILLAEHFLRQNSSKFGKQIQTLAPETVQILKSYQWPGNVRELESVIKQALLNARGTMLLPDFLPPLSRDSNLEESSSDSTLQQLIQNRIDAGSTDIYGEVITNVERQLLETILDHTNGHQVRAAELLGISRVTLRSKIRQLGINVAEFSRKQI